MWLVHAAKPLGARGRARISNAGAVPVSGIGVRGASRAIAGRPTTPVARNARPAFTPGGCSPHGIRRSNRHGARNCFVGQPLSCPNCGLHYSPLRSGVTSAKLAHWGVAYARCMHGAESTRGAIGRRLLPNILDLCQAWVVAQRWVSNLRSCCTGPYRSEGYHPLRALALRRRQCGLPLGPSPAL